MGPQDTASSIMLEGCRAGPSRLTGLALRIVRTGPLANRDSSVARSNPDLPWTPGELSRCSVAVILGPVRMPGPLTAAVASRGRREGWTGLAPLREVTLVGANREAWVNHGEVEAIALQAKEAAATASRLTCTRNRMGPRIASEAGVSGRSPGPIPSSPHFAAPLALPGLPHPAHPFRNRASDAR